MPPTEQALKHLENAKQLVSQKKFNAAFSEFELAIRRDYGNAEVHAKFAAALLKAGRFPKAVQQFRKAIELDPAARFNVRQLVEALSHDVRQEEDLADFQKIVDKADRARLFHKWALVLAKLERPGQAIEAFALALKKDPEIELDVESLVQAFKDSNAPEQHIKKFQDDVDNLNNGVARNTWGKILLGLTRYAAAAQQFEQAANVRSDWAEPYINHGRALIELADHQQAIVLLRQALQCEEQSSNASLYESSNAYFYLGVALNQIREYQETVTNYQVASVKAPAAEYFGPWLDALKKLPDPDPAIAEYQNALDEYQNALERNGSTYSDFAEFLKQRGRLSESAILFARSLPDEEAVTQLQETLSDLQDPQPTLDAIQEIFDEINFASDSIDWAQVLARIDQVERAKAQLSKIEPLLSNMESQLKLLTPLVSAFKSSSDRADVQNQIGKMISKLNNGALRVEWAQVLVNDLNNYVQGLELFQKVLVTAPTSDGLVEAFATALKTAPNQLSSIENTQAEVNKAKDATVFYQWALILITLGRGTSAMAALQRATDLMPDYAEAHYQLALVFARRGDYKKARKEFQKADSNKVSPQVIQDWGTTLLKEGRKEEAISKYLQALRQGGDLLRIRERLNWDDELVARFQKVIDEVHSARTYHQWGTLLRGIKRYELAIQQFKQAISLDPDMWDSHVEWLKALGALGLSAKLLDEYEEWLVKYQHDAKAFRFLGRFLFNLKQNELAIQKVEYALQLDPKHVEARQLLINCCLVENDINQLRKEAQRLLADDPNNSYAYFYISWSAFIDGDYEESIRQVEQGIEQGLNYYYLHNRSAWGWYKLGREDLARKKLDDALKADSGVDAYYQHGALLIEMKRYEEATVALQKVLDLSPDHVYASQNLAAIPYVQGRYDEAWQKLRHTIEVYEKQEPLLNRAIEHGTADSDGTSYHANLLMATQPNKHEEAKKLLQKGLEFDQNNTYILRALADLHRDQKEEFLDFQSASNRQKSECHWQSMEYFQRAEKLLKQRLERYSTYYALVELGDLYLANEDFDKARTYFEQARAKDDKSAMPYAKLGVINLRERQPDKAIPLLQEALKRNPDDLDVKSSLAEAYLRAEKLDDAETTYRQVLNIAPNHVQSSIGLGEVCMAMGAKDSDRYTEGMEHFSRALETAENEKIRSKYLKKQEKAAVYYQRGYASVQLYEGFGSRKDTKLLEAAKRDFDLCQKLNPLHQKARRAKEKVDKRLAYFSRDRLTDTIGPKTIYWMSITVFLVVQLAFFIMPLLNRPSLVLSDKSLQAAAAQASPEELKSLTALKNLRFSNSADLANAVKPLLLAANVEKVTAAVLQNAERVKPVENFPELEGGYYALLTFGSLLFMVVGLYLPQILKLRVAGIELEKSSVDQAATGGTLGISK